MDTAGGSLPLGEGQGRGLSTHLAAIGHLLLAVTDGGDAGEVLDDPLGVDRLPRPGFSAGGRWGRWMERGRGWRTSWRLLHPTPPLWGTVGVGGRDLRDEDGLVLPVCQEKREESGGMMLSEMFGGLGVLHAPQVRSRSRSFLGGEVFLFGVPHLSACSGRRCQRRRRCGVELRSASCPGRRPPLRRCRRATTCRG